VGDTSYQFVTTQSVTASNSGSSIQFNNVTIAEGSFVATRYTADTQNVEQRFVINDDRADTTTLTIKSSKFCKRILESATYTRANRYLQD